MTSMSTLSLKVRDQIFQPELVSNLVVDFSGNVRENGRYITNYAATQDERCISLGQLVEFFCRDAYHSFGWDRYHKKDERTWRIERQNLGVANFIVDGETVRIQPEEIGRGLASETVRYYSKQFCDFVLSQGLTICARYENDPRHLAMQNRQ